MSGRGNVPSWRDSEARYVPDPYVTAGADGLGASRAIQVPAAIHNACIASPEESTSNATSAALPRGVRPMIRVCEPHPGMDA